MSRRAGRARWVTIAATAAVSPLLGAATGRPWIPDASAPSRIVIREAGPGEQALRVSGRVFAPDGVTPAAGVVLYVYHTDVRGLYADRPGPPRLRGWMRTAEDGGYEYRTIRPASYPGRRVPAHVHTQLWGGPWPAQWNHELRFADDPFVDAGERRRSAAAGRFAWVCDPAPDADGALSCRHDLRLRPDGDELEDNIRHGLQGPGGER
jgi:protocatechuate 3,4-dioxygenase beta subunit